MTRKAQALALPPPREEFRVPMVYSYTRFSDPRQGSGQSAERQTALAEAWAAARGLKLDASLNMHDEGLSAFHARHVKSGALGTFLTAIEAGRIARGSILLVEQFDRLSRENPQDAFAQLSSIINAGVKVVTTTDGQEWSRESLTKNPEKILMSIITMMRAHEESSSKSRRSFDALHSLCKRWQEGTFRGVIRIGRDPQWLKREGDAWKLIPSRVAALRSMVESYLAGHGGAAIRGQQARAGMQISEHRPTQRQVYRLIQLPAVAGDKVVMVEGKEYTLTDYYPPVITRAQWAEVQAMATQRKTSSRRPEASSTGFVHVLTGTGILRCGYCGNAVCSKNIKRPLLPDGRIRDYARRMECLEDTGHERCPVGGSRSIVPLERTIIGYCRDMLNLQALYGPDSATAPRARVEAARAAVAETGAQLERVARALITAGDTPPATFVKLAQELEARKASEQRAQAAAEQELATSMRRSITTLDDRFAAVAVGVEAQDAEARSQARQLVADTFERITVYSQGVIPQETPKGVMDVVLLAKGGVERLLRIGANGDWTAGEDADTQGVAA